MKIAFNPSTVAALITPPNNKDITFDLRGRNIFARGVKFCGTDTWRDIKINNVSIGSNTLDLRNGSNTTLTNTNGVVTINSTWRPVVDNLTSDSTTSSLSAKQGKVLKSLIDGKSDSGHTHDDRYVKKSGDTMRGALNFANGTWNLVGDDVYMGDHNIGGQLCIMGANSTTGLSFHKLGDASIRKSITFDGNTLYMNGSCNYATLSNLTNLLAMNTVPNKTAATSIGSWSPISGRYVFHQKWTDTSTGGDSADFGIYLDGNLTANMVLDGYYNSLLGFRVIGATSGFLKANGTIDNSTYLTSHLSLSNYYTKSEVDTKLNSKLNYRLFWERTNIDLNSITEAWHTYEVNNGTGTANTPTNASWHLAVLWGTGDTDYAVLLCTAYTSNYSLYLRHKIAGKWNNWIQLATTTDIPSSLKNPHALTISLNGTSQGPYDGSAAKNINITPGSIGAATSGHAHDNKYLKWLGNAGLSNMNAIGRISHSSGMTNLSDSGNTIDNPMEGGSKSTSWHLYWLTNYTDDPSGSNAWVALIVNRAGTDRWWVRSRSGGTITNGANWTSNWRFLVTAPTSGLGGSSLPVYINSAGEVVAANSYPTTLPANGGNADTVDSYHANGLLTALSNSNKGISITVGGTNKSISNINVNGADTILGTSPQIAAATEHNSIYVSSPGYTSNKPVKMLCFDWYGNYWALSNIRSGSEPSAGFGVFFKNTEIARFTSDGNLSCNAASATKWATARALSLTGSITGSASFDGSGNIILNTTYGTENISNLDSRYLKRTGDTMSGALSFSPTDGSDAAPKIYSTISGALTSLNFEVSDDADDRFVFKINYWNDDNTTNRERFIIDWNNVTSKAPITAPSFNGNATSATKLQTSRLLWGQPFDGTGNVSGFMKNVTGLIHGNNIGDDWSDGNNTHPWYGIDYRHCVDSTETGKAYTSISSYFGLYFKTGGSRFIFDGGNVGIGTASPIEKLDVHGNIISNNIRIYGNEVTNNSKGLFIQASDKTNRAFLTYNGNVENTSYLNICSTFGNIVLSPYRNVGIGTTTPAYKLDVIGSLRIYSTYPLLRIENSSGGTAETSIYISNGTAGWAIGVNPWGVGSGVFGIGQYSGSGSSNWRFKIDNSGYCYTQSYLNLGAGNEKNASSPPYVWGVNGSDNYLRTYATSALRVAYASNATNSINSNRLSSNPEFALGNNFLLYFNTAGLESSGVNNAAPDKDWWHIIRMNHPNSKGYFSELAIALNSYNGVYWRTINFGREAKPWTRLANIEDLAWNNIVGKPSSYTPSAHTHSWTSITDKLVAGNEFNIVNAGFNAGIWFNYVPINDRSKTATITGYHFGNGATGYTSINASGFIKKGSNSNYVLLGDGGHKLESSLNVAHATTSGLSWDVPILGQHWSRLFVGNPHIIHHSSIFSISGSIGCVVFCLTFLVESNHPSSATIICLFSGSYTLPKMRALAKSDGTVLVDLFWSGSDCSLSSSTQQMTINVIANALLGSISPITTLTNDDTIPSGYSNTCEFLCASKTSNFYNIRATGNSYATHFYESSDKTLKKNIKSILSSTNIPKIREFDWKDTGEHSYGFIALELEELGYGCLVNEADGKKTVNYTATLALTVAKLLNLINIQNKKISNLTKELKALKYGRKKNS